MGRFVVVVAVALLVVSVAAGEEYLLWYPDPNNMGATVGTAATVEGGQNLYYTVTSTDKDMADLMVDGEKKGNGLFVDPTFWVDDEENDKPYVRSCPTGWDVSQTGFDGATGTYSFEFHGVAQQWVEQADMVYDHWWFDDVAEIETPPHGSRNDEELGPLQKAVYLTPSVGWVVGSVEDQWGTPLQCQVELYQNGQPTGYQADADGNGMYIIHYVYPGNYVARANWGMGGEANAAVTKGQGTQADIVVQGGP